MRIRTLNSPLREKAIKMKIPTQFFVMVLTIATLEFVPPAWAQDRPANNMDILREKVQADKKLLVATNLGLTGSEAKLFWPIYEEYQTILRELNRRIRRLLESYAEAHNSKTLTNEKARNLIREYLSIEADETKLKGAYIPKLNMVLPAKKVARYIQIENKIRAVFNYDLAAAVPLIQ